MRILDRERDALIIVVNLTGGLPTASPDDTRAWRNAPWDLVNRDILDPDSPMTSPRDVTPLLGGIPILALESPR